MKTLKSLADFKQRIIAAHWSNFTLVILSITSALLLYGMLIVMKVV